MKLRTTIAITIFFLACISPCISNAGAQMLRMATTTSTDNTGLLDYLAPNFEKETEVQLQWVAVGTGNALELGKNCDVDILFVHAPSAEKKYVKDGYGINRRKVMYNDFVIIGPNNDPAKVKGLSAIHALATFAKKKILFVSRGDNSGTNKKELGLWMEAKIRGIDKESWYIQTGQGMLATINIATELDGYTLTDRGTYIKYEANMRKVRRLAILVEGDAKLYNQYSVLEVNPQRCPVVKNNLAKIFSNWIVSPRTQKLIGAFKLMGKRLFKPNAE